MQVAISDHQGKAHMLRQALERQGHVVTDRYPVGDVLLIDYDGPYSHYPDTIKRHVDGGAKVFLYQHGANPMTHYDGIQEPHPAVRGFFTFAPGYKAVMEAYGYPHPVHVVGWYYCPLVDWQPVEDIKRILYAPWHPIQSDFIPPMGKALNREISDDLAAMKKARPDLHIRVRHVGPLVHNNLQQEPGLDYRLVSVKLEWDDIDWADVIISHGTFARMAVARGKPTLFYGQEQTPYDGFYESYREVDNFHKYRHLMQYPWDYDDGPGLWDLLQQVSQSEPTTWKAGFIGKPFDGELFSNLLVSELHAEAVR